MKLLKTIIIILLSLVILTSLVIWVITKNINPQIIKELVNQEITRLTHKNSRIDGVISWQLFPRPGLKFSKIQIGDDDLGEHYTLSVDTLVLNLKVTPLLRGHFIFSDINLDGLKMQINLDIPSPTHLIDIPAQKKTIENISNNQFAIERLVLNHGQITIQTKWQTTVLKNIQIGMEQFNLQNTPFPLQIKAKLGSAAPGPIIKATLNFQGRFSLSPTMMNELFQGILTPTAEGQLVVQDVLFNRLSIKKINATLKSDRNDITLNPIALCLYNGESVGDINFSHATQQVSINQTATNLDGKQLTTALLGHDAISGNLDYSLHASFPLNQLKIINSSGTGSVTVKEGELLHINLAEIIKDLQQKLNSIVNEKSIDLKNNFQMADWNKSKYSQGNTAFKLASIQYQLHHGSIDTDSLIIQTNLLQIKGKAHLNLSNHELDSKIKAIMNNNNTDSAMQKIQDLLGGGFPLLISGTLEQPIIIPDFKAISYLLSQLLIKSALAKPVKQIKEDIKELFH